MEPKTIPILPSPDLDETARFYAALGFTEGARYPGEYLVMHHPRGIELHFWWHPGLDPLANDAGCYVRFGSAAEAESLHREWSGDLDDRHLRPLEDPGYNLLEFALLDSHRNLVRVGGFIDPSPE